MLSVSPSSLARSSLEEMLESLRQRDEVEKAKDMPPALPVRPRATSRKRLPSAKRSLPPNFKIGDSELPECPSNVNIKKDDMKGSKCNSFVAKKIKEMDRGESPYVVVSENAKCEPESDENLGYFTEKKLCVWCRCLNGLWESGSIQSTSGDKALVLVSDGSVVAVPMAELLPANPDILEGVDDLIQLSYLNRPSVLHNLQYRYSRDMIYSKAGPVLIAVNPLKDVDIYGNDFVTAYREKLLDSPHVYAIAETAYNKMITDDINQSIIISGESGAGKTETAKIAMQYLVSVGGGPGGIESEVLQTSCILEAFGHAKTSRNNNSSRFGKFIETHFSATGNMCGAKIQTFLLEKSRVVWLAHGERSYHIFYQLCAGVPSSLRGRLRLKMASDYNYLIQSGCLTINDVDDAQKFHSLVEALNSVGICQEDQEHAFEMLAAVLWLGNISFHVMDTENHIEVVVDEAVSNAASLIGCSTEDLILTLSTSRIQASADNVVKEQTLQQAMDTRDSLAKFIYASLFDWVVEEINKSLMGNHPTGRSISILDVYGFESFQKNSLEQFCINYANERLQQHFNRHLFKLEQEEYELDGINWTKVEFEDNQDRLDLFEKKPTGLISLLDEESSAPGASELTFAAKLKQHLSACSCFKGGTGGAFSIRHYAGEVLYDTGEFLEKNRDLLHSDTIQLLSSCSGQLPRLFASTWLNQSLKAESSSIHLGMSACQKQSVAAKFKSQMFRLMQQLENTTPHFIQCIKPNSKQLPGTFEKDLVSEQLRYCGILEVARISRFGYPTRMTHQEFTRRYACLLPENNACQNPLSTSVAILQQLGIPPEMYQVGYRKLYFRVGQIGALEDVREQVLQGTLEVQKCFRSRACRNFHELTEGVVMLQSFVRGDIARRKYGALLGSNEPVALKKIENHVVQIQSGIRGWLARRKYSELRNLKNVDHCKWKGDREVSEVKDMRREMLPSVVEELQRRVLLAEATLEQKEKENASLKDKVQQFETQWSEYETRMKSMEDVWQKQIVSLQMSLAAAKKSLCAENMGQPGRNDGSPSPCYYDSEDTSIGTQTPGGSTPVKFHYNVLGLGAIQETNGGLNAVNPLLKEFEQRKQAFEDEARAITESKSGQSASVNTIDELRKLKHRFEYWKKDYKARLKEAKAKAIRLGHTEAEKHRRSWWGKKSKKIQQ